MKFITNLRALLIAIWLGAALFFISVAQSSFAVLPTRELAGSVVNRTLMILNISGLVIAGILLVASFFIKSPDLKPVWAWAERVFLILVAAACAVGQFVFALWLSIIRMNQFGGKPIDEIPLEDPARIQFNAVHQYSTWALIAGMVAALIVFFLITRNTSAAPEKKKASTGFELPDDLKL